MVKISSIGEAEPGDFINHKGKIFVISSIQQKDEYFIVELVEGEIIVVFNEQKTEIFRVNSRR